MYTSGRPSVSTPDGREVIERKRKRLTFACNACRARKVKCDDRQEQCSNCFKAHIKCETTDPRQNGKIAQRKHAQSRQVKSKAKPTTPLTSSSPAIDQFEPGTAPNLSAVNLISSDNSGRSTDTDVLDVQSPEPTVHNAPLPVLPRFLFGNSLQVLTQWLDLAFARIGVPHRFYNQFFINRLRKEPSPLMSLASRVPACPVVASDIANHIDAYLQSINIIYPIFEETQIRKIAESYSTSRSRDNVYDDCPSSSAIAILVDVIGEISQPTSNSTTKQRLIDKLVAAFSLLAMIVAENSLRSIQALILLTIALRGYNETKTAWHIVTLTVSMAQSLGLNRAQDQSRQHNAVAEESVRTWWALYCLEKALSLETERQSSIKDSDCNQNRPKMQQDPPVFGSLINLAAIQSQINERCITARLSEENWGAAYSDIIREKLENCGELDQMLLSWAEELPISLRLTNYLFCPLEVLPCVSFLAIQYHQTLVLLHRNNVLVNAEIARKEIDYFCVNKPYIHRLRMGKIICDDAARSIVHVLENMHSNQADSILSSINAPLIATYALAIHLLKNPTLGLAKSDLELQMRAIRFVQNQRRLLADEDEIQSNLLDSLHREVSSQVHKAIQNQVSLDRTGNEDSIQRIPKAARRKGFGLNHLSNAETTRALQRGPNGQQDLAGDYAAHMSGSDSPNMFLLGSLNETYLQSDAYGSLDFDQLDVDWDALALTFDLPDECQT